MCMHIVLHIGWVLNGQSFSNSFSASLGRFLVNIYVHT